MAKQMRGVILALIFTLLFTSWMSAQETNQARLTPPETDNFPYITTYLDVRDAEGDFVYGLDPQDVSVLENGRRLPVAELNQLRPGVQFVAAINPGAAFNIRDLQGISRYDYIYEALDRWAHDRQGTTLDDLSLLTVDGPVATHLSDPNAWISTLQPYQPENGNNDLGFEILGRALELAADNSNHPGMGRAVLFITSLPEQDATLFLESLAVRARQREVRIFVWLVTSASLYYSPNAIQLQNLATQTGGEFYPYSGVEPVPNLEDYLEPLRSTYALSYESRITTSGIHQIAAYVKTDQLTITSSEQEFEIEVLPPNVAFISPDLEVKRTVSEGTEGEPEVITPSLHHLEVLVEFPDGHVRPLRRTRLFVDDQVVHQNLTPPFEHFTWDLSEYTSTDSHRIQVEVIDSLGLSSTSIEQTILVSVDQPVQQNRLTLTRNRSLVVGAVVLLAGSILMLILVMGGRIQPGFAKASRNGRRRSDPVTQPVKAKIEPKTHRLPDWFNRLYWPQRRVEVQASAILVRISDAEQSKTLPPIPITADELTFGRDPTLVTQILEDPSVEAIHARLRLGADNAYRLYDEGSTAGTWVNYTPISPEGSRLEHGDLIHIGRVGFRFSLREAVNIRKPTITKKEFH
jgi:hypothetical protein